MPLFVQNTLNIFFVSNGRYMNYPDHTHLTLSWRGSALFGTGVRAGLSPCGRGIRGELGLGGEGGRGGVYPQLRIQFIDLSDCDIALWNKPFEKWGRDEGVKRNTFKWVKNYY